MKKFKYINLFWILFLFCIVDAGSKYLKPVKDLMGDIEVFINFLDWALPALAVIAFFYLIVVYIYNKTSGRNVSVRGGGIFWSIVALAVLFGLYGFIQLIAALFGINIETQQRPVIGDVPPVTIPNPPVIIPKK